LLKKRQMYFKFTITDTMDKPKDIPISKLSL